MLTHYLAAADAPDLTILFEILFIAAGLIVLRAV